MFDKDEPEPYFDHINLCGSGRDYVAACLDQAPTRTVINPGGCSVVGRFYSRKLQETRSYESRTAELPHLIQLDIDPSVMYFVTQPVQIDIPAHNKKNVPYKKTYTTDSLAIRPTGITAYECKTAEFLESEIEKNSKDWDKDLNGEYTYVPAKKAFNNIGIDHKVFDNAATPPILAANYSLLQKIIYLATPPSACQIEMIEKQFTRKAFIPMSTILARTGLPCLDPIFYMIVTRKLAASISKQYLGDPRTIVAKDEDLLEAILQKDSEWDFSKSIYVPNPEEAKQAVERLTIMQTQTSRSSYRYARLVKEGEAQGLTAFQSLIPRDRFKGNRNAKITTKQKDLVREHIRAWYLSGELKTVRACYDQYCGWAEDADKLFGPVSLPTYYRLIEEVDKAVIEKVARGRRGEISGERHVDVEQRGARAQHSMEIAAIDHTLLKQYACIVLTESHMLVARPYLSSMVDHYSGQILGQWISFRRPSRHAIAMLFRLCIAEHKRLPQMIHVDRGAEFTSRYAALVASHFGVSTSFSPTAKSRFNSQVERVFGLLQQGLIKNLSGNIIDYDRRKYSDNARPENSKIFHIDALVDVLFRYRDSFNNKIRGIEQMSPALRFEESIALSEVFGNRVDMDQYAFLATCVPIESKQWSNTGNGSILFKNMNFYSSHLRDRRLRKKDLTLRVNPENPFELFFQLRSSWYSAKASGSPAFLATTQHRQYSEAIRIPDCRRYNDKSKELSRVDLMRSISDAIELQETAKTHQAKAQPAAGGSIVDENDLEHVFQQTLDMENDNEVLNYD